MNKFFSCNLIALSLLLSACSIVVDEPNTDIKSYGSRHIEVFNDEQVSHGHPDANSHFKLDDGGVLRLSKGRIILKKIKVPHFEKSTQVQANIRLVSNGDPWDKSGSLFIIPQDSIINLVSLQKKENKLDNLMLGNDKIQGYVADNNYIPSLELVRFMTPFGVGHFSKSEKLDGRKPVYIPKWEKEVNWQQDITDRLSALEGEVWVGVWIDVWTKEGYKIDVSLTFDESVIAQDKRQEKWLQPLVNTVNYVHPIKFADIFSRNDLTTTFSIPDNVSNIKLKYITTGHGGHSRGDEFVKKDNVILVDGKQILKFTPWRDDCASFRRFNPHSGIWTQKTMWKGKEIDERVASSDLSRSNWCPGSDVPPVEVHLGDLKEGKHTLTVSIPNAQPVAKDEMNRWLVSAYLVGDKVIVENL